MNLPNEQIQALSRLSKDQKKAAITLTDHEARFLVDTYYQMQKNRIRTGNQITSLEKDQEPNSTLRWLFSESDLLENNIKAMLDSYSMGSIVGQWSRLQSGIGPVLAAGLLAHIDIKQAPTVGHIWNFAGLNPKMKWTSNEEATEIVNRISQVIGKGNIDELISLVAIETGVSSTVLRKRIAWQLGDEEKKITKAHVIAAVCTRPWNAALKTLCWKIGESFVKVSGKEEALYGQLYKMRKELELQKNEAGDLKEAAEKALSLKNYSRDTDAKKCYTAGKLPPAHIHARAKRYAVCIFLSHWHEIAYEASTGEKPPKPFAISILGHGHYIDVPNREILLRG